MHGHLKTILVPLVKNKTDNTNEVSNYRPIAIVTAMPKLFEMVLHQQMKQYNMYTNENQFGFKKNHSTDVYRHHTKYNTLL